MKREYKVRLAERDNFNHFLKKYLDKHYDKYINRVIKRYEQIEKDHGNSLDMDGLLELMNVEEQEADRKLYKHLYDKNFPVRDRKEYYKKIRTFASVIVQEAWPKISANYRKVQAE